MENLIKETSVQIIKDFEMEKLEGKELSEEELLRVLEQQVAYYIEHNLDFLLSSLYRLDISEKLVRAALLPSSDVAANVAIAKLILNRQKKRVFTKRFYKQKEIEDLGEEWKF